MVAVADIQSLLVLRVGDTADSLLSHQVGLIWTSYADKALIAPRLQELYSQRELVDIALGELRQGVDFSMSGDLSLHLSDRQKYLHTMRDEVQKEICIVEARALANRAPVVIPLTTTEIELPPEIDPKVPSPVIDANDVQFRGDPYVGAPLIEPPTR